MASVILPTNGTKGYEPLTRSVDEMMAGEDGAAREFPQTVGQVDFLEVGRRLG